MWPKESQAEIFERLIAPHMNSLFQTACRLVGNADDAEDLVQEVLLKLYPQTGKLQRIEMLSPWLKKVIYREFIDGLRKKSRRPEGQLSELNSEVSNPNEDVHDPENFAARVNDFERLWSCLQELPGESRSLLLMHLVEGYTIAELEEFFQIPAETLKTRLRRAKLFLKKKLQIL